MASTKRYDIVYPVGPHPGWGDYEELRYSLRSVAANLKNHGRVYLIGHCPRWAKEGKDLIHVPAKDPYGQNKDANLINKVLLACTIPDLTDNFVYISDDQYFWQPVTGEQVAINYYERDYAGFTQWKPNSKWQRRIKRTIERLRMLGLPQFKYEGHIPIVINKQFFPQVMLQHPYGEDIGYCIKSLYLNSIGLESHSSEIDKVRFSTTKHDMSYRDLRLDSDGKQYVNLNVRNFKPPFQRLLQENFPNKSIFEK